LWSIYRQRGGNLSEAYFENTSINSQYWSGTSNLTRLLSSAYLFIESRSTEAAFASTFC